MYVLCRTRVPSHPSGISAYSHEQTGKRGRSRLKCKLWRSGDGYKRLSTDQSCVNADKEVTAQECDSVADTNSHNEELQFMKI
ncbi:unnamed protein product [Timema podura]|uniref:Uncharacterized protein n=1 Tax=Timema podura TaxID=61482 RepID=A0ABN7PT35_TIMPD|nr:unnamed protein product [Timema podura]